MMPEAYGQVAGRKHGCDQRLTDIQMMGAKPLNMPKKPQRFHMGDFSGAAPSRKEDRRKYIEAKRRAKSDD